MDEMTNASEDMIEQFINSPRTTTEMLKRALRTTAQAEADAVDEREALREQLMETREELAKAKDEIRRLKDRYLLYDLYKRENEMYEKQIIAFREAAAALAATVEEG